MNASDIPTLMFVDPDELEHTWRVVLWGPPGVGKSVGAASAPGPIVVVSADRPRAYKTARRIHADQTIHEVRYEDPTTLGLVYRYLREHPEIKTVVIDPFHNIYDRLVESAPKRRDGEPDYQGVNKKLLGFIYSLREFDVNLVLVAHEKLNDGKGGDGKMYPQLGGPSLINKIMAECDIVAHVQREQTEDGRAVFYGQLAPVGNLVTKDSTGADLGVRRELDLAEWFEVASTSEKPDNSDLPFDEDYKPPPAPPAISAKRAAQMSAAIKTAIAEHEHVRDELPQLFSLAGVRVDKVTAKVVKALTPEQADRVMELLEVPAEEVTPENPDGPGGQFDMDEARAEA